MSRMLMLRQLIVFSILLLFCACKATIGESCGKPEDCASGLQCSSHDFVCFDPLAEQKCQKSCAHNGECLARGGECVATIDTCLKTDSCKNFGICGEEGGECKGTDEGCLKSWYCRKSGKCQLGDENLRIGGLACVASDDGCRVTELCSVLGRCRASERTGDCVADDAGCRATDSCKVSGKCWAQNGECVEEYMVSGSKPGQSSAQ
jgi:hypothetical protein